MPCNAIQCNADVCAVCIETGPVVGKTEQRAFRIRVTILNPVRLSGASPLWHHPEALGKRDTPRSVHNLAARSRGPVFPAAAKLRQHKCRITKLIVARFFFSFHFFLLLFLLFFDGADDDNRVAEFMYEVIVHCYSFRRC